MAKAKAVAKTADKAPALANQYEEDADGGFEGADKDSYAIPMLNILQKGSPQVDEADGAYIEGARPGMLFNNITERCYDKDKGVIVVPCAFRRTFIEWAPRESGGGFVAEYSVEVGEEKLLNECTRDQNNRECLENGNYLADTRSHYVLLVDLETETFEPCLIAMSSTQLKKSRRWMSQMRNKKMKRADGSLYTPSMFSHMYKLTTVPESNDKGSWFGWKHAEFALVEDQAMYDTAKSFKDSVMAGEVRAKMDTAEPSADAAPSGDVGDDY
jgi:hypothetical protein